MEGTDSEKLHLVNGTEFSVPKNTIPEIKQIIEAIENYRTLPEQSPEWAKWGHRLGNAEGSLISVAFFGGSPEEQKHKLEGLTRFMLRQEAGIRPLLEQFHFPITK